VNNPFITFLALLQPYYILQSTHNIRFPLAVSPLHKLFFFKIYKLTWVFFKAFFFKNFGPISPNFLISIIGTLVKHQHQLVANLPYHHVSTNTSDVRRYLGSETIYKNKIYVFIYANSCRPLNQTLIFSLRLTSTYYYAVTKEIPFAYNFSFLPHNLLFTTFINLFYFKLRLY